MRIASPPSSWTVEVGALHWMAPPTSSSLMVTTAAAGAMSETVAGGSPVIAALPTSTTNVRSCCGSELLRIGTVKVRVATDGVNVSVPVVTV